MTLSLTHDLRASLGALRDKYERMLALRVAHVRAYEDPTFVEPNPRRAMAALAEEFPGALRELDTLPLDEIERRIQSLGRAEEEPSASEPWMHAQMLFHRYARGAVVTKRWLAGRKDITPAIKQAFARAIERLPRGEDAGLFAGELEHVAHPPRGRVMDLVHAKVARAMDIADTEVRALVFGVRGSP